MYRLSNTDRPSHLPSMMRESSIDAKLLMKKNKMTLIDGKLSPKSAKEAKKEMGRYTKGLERSDDDDSSGNTTSDDDDDNDIDDLDRIGIKHPAPESIGGLGQSFDAEVSLFMDDQEIKDAIRKSAAADYRVDSQRRTRASKNPEFAAKSGQRLSHAAKQETSETKKMKRASTSTRASMQQ